MNKLLFYDDNGIQLSLKNSLSENNIKIHGYHT